MVWYLIIGLITIIILVWWLRQDTTIRQCLVFGEPVKTGNNEYTIEVFDGGLSFEEVKVICLKTLFEIDGKKYYPSSCNKEISNYIIKIDTD